MYFTLANESAYFCGCTDISSAGMGFHVPGKMGGLWDPPLKLVERFDVVSGGGRVRPSALIVRSSGIEMEYDGFSIELMMPEDMLMLVRVKNEDNREVEVNFSIDPQPIWLSDFKTRHQLSRRHRQMSLNIPSLRRIYTLETDASSLLEEHRLVRIGSREDFGISIRRKSRRKHKNLVECIERTEKKHKLISRRTVLETPDTQLADAFHWAKHSLSWLTHRQNGIGRGLTAGHCDYPWYFSIDFYYSLDALLETGMCSVAKDSLMLFIKYARLQGGRVPHEIVTNGIVYNKGDLEESAMLSTAILKYVEWTGDLRFAREHFTDAMASLEYVVSRKFTGPAIMEDAGRGGSVELDTLCYFAEGVESLAALKKIAFENDSGVYSAEISSLNRAAGDAMKIVNSGMWIGEQCTYANRLTSGVPENPGFWTSIIPFVTRVASESRYRSFINSENGLKRLVGIDGLLIGSASVKTMAIQNGLMSLAASQYHDTHTALKFYSFNIGHAGEFMPGVVPEILNDATGCYLQAWSSAAVIHPLIGGILGIRPVDGKLKSGRKVGNTLNGLRINGIPFRGGTFDFEVLDGRVVSTSNE